MNALLPLAVTAEPVLRAIQAGGFSSTAQLGALANRDPKNMARDLGRLAEAGLILRGETIDDKSVTLTAAGLEQLSAIERANAVQPLHDEIEADPFNPRDDFDEEFIKGLADVIFAGGKRDGMLQRIVIRPREGGSRPFRIIAGENRWRAIGLLIADGRWPRDLPPPTEIRIMTDEEAEIFSLLENVQRMNLNAIEEAKRYKHFRDVRGWGTAKIAETAKRSQKHVQNMLRCLDLPSDVQERMRLPKGDERHIGAREARSMFQQQREPEVPKLELDAPLTLVLLEVADKAQKFPATHLGEPGFTEITEWPTGGSLWMLNQKKVVTFKTVGDKSYVKVLGYSCGALAWLEARKFYSDPDGAREHARKQIAGLPAREDGLYYTPELNIAPPVASTTTVHQDAAGDVAHRPAVRRDRSTAEDRVAASIQLDRDARETRLTELGVNLPSTLEEMAPYARLAMEDYDRAQIAGDELVAKAARERFDACAFKLNGNKLLGAATPADELRQTFAAPIGDVPKWGQPGRFLLNIDGMTAAVEIKDNFGWSNVGFYAVDADAPFFSPTGFRSDFFGHGMHELKTLDGASVLVATARMMRLNIAEYLRPKKPAAIDRESIARHLGYYPWLQELTGLTVHNGVAAIEEHEAAAEARQDAEEANPVRQEPAAPSFKAHIRQAANGLAETANAMIELRPDWKPSANFAWRLADSAVRYLAHGDAGRFMADYARLVAAVGEKQASSEVGAVFRRLGLDRMALAMALDADSPSYAAVHKGCYGVGEPDPNDPHKDNWATDEDEAGE